MDPRTASERRETGLFMLGEGKREQDRLKGYFTGEGQDRPYAPEGVSEEYLQLREMAMAPWLDLVVRSAVQRQVLDGFRTNKDAVPDKVADAKAWEFWQANKLDARQSMVYTDRCVYGQGIVSVWPNGPRPKISPESPRRVYLHPSEDDPFEHDWALKAWSTATPSTSPLAGSTRVTRHAVVYDVDSWMRYRWASGDGNWVLTGSGSHDHGLPFVAFPHDQDSEGNYFSEIARLIPLQDSINTTRFNLSLAMQFAAFRQRGVIGYDPVQRDPQGNPIPMKDANGQVIIDPATGQPKPAINPPPRAGVDRTWVFPGANTKIFEFTESNLEAYVKAQAAHVQHLAALSQTPPHYLLGQLANLSAEALTAAESTLTRKVLAACTADGEGWEEVMRKSSLAAGVDAATISTQAVWRNTESVSIGQVVDAIQKLVGGPVLAPESGREMIPNATAQDQIRWTSQFDSHQTAAASRVMFGDLAGALTAPKFQAAGQPPVPAGV